MSNDWRDDAACLYVGPDPFFQNRYSDTVNAVVAARTICRGCPVRAHCLTQALHHERDTAHGNRDGIFGGHTPAEREAMRAGEVTSDHFTAHGTYQGWLLGCHCDLCEEAYERQLRKEALAKPMPAGIQHGKLNGYLRWGCHCEPCVATATAAGLIRPRQLQAA
jgi:hypothetical protein